MSGPRKHSEKTYNPRTVAIADMSRFVSISALFRGVVALVEMFEGEGYVVNDTLSASTRTPNFWIDGVEATVAAASTSVNRVCISFEIPRVRPFQTMRARKRRISAFPQTNGSTTPSRMTRPTR